MNACNLEAHAASWPFHELDNTRDCFKLVASSFETLQRHCCCSHDRHHGLGLTTLSQVIQKPSSIKLFWLNAHGVLHSSSLHDRKIYGLWVSMACPDCCFNRTTQLLCTPFHIVARNANWGNSHCTAVGKGSTWKGKKRRHACLIWRNAFKGRLHHTFRCWRATSKMLVVIEHPCTTFCTFNSIYLLAGNNRRCHRQACIGVICVHTCAHALLCHGRILCGPCWHEVHIIHSHCRPVCRRLSTRYKGTHWHRWKKVLDQISSPSLLRQ
mmetsp:Transcript_62684/g.123937  ORF Transcript_62684/g.123937 Transcript_62684/m.123937 type:complete len:268 (-) Transcript_62684:179-982(-)